MIMYIHNSGVIGLANNWSVGERVHHVSTKASYLLELKEQNLIETQYQKVTQLQINNGTENNPSGLFWSQTTKFMSYPSNNG